MSLAPTSTRETDEPVDARVRYLHPRFRDSRERAEIGSRETRRANTSIHDVVIHNGRPLAEANALDLDTTGFILTELPTTFSEHRDPEKVSTHYYPVVCEHLQRLTGAAHVFVASHLLRTEDGSSFNEAYARFVHCDYPLRNPLKSARFALKELGSELDPMAYEFAWYNFWQPFDHEAEHNPLALIDSTSIEDGDLVEYLYTANGLSAPSTMPVQNPAHRFYYFPRMQLHEVLVFKQLDSRDGGRVACPHTSFDHPGASPDAPPRRSIEVRLICAFPKSPEAAAV